MFGELQLYYLAPVFIISLTREFPGNRRTVTQTRVFYESRRLSSAQVASSEENISANRVNWVRNVVESFRGNGGQVAKQVMMATRATRGLSCATERCSSRVETKVHNETS